MKTRAELRSLQERFDAPLRRWDDSLTAITDELEGNISSSQEMNQGD